MLKYILLIFICSLLPGCIIQYRGSESSTRNGGQGSLGPELNDKYYEREIAKATEKDDVDEFKKLIKQRPNLTNGSFLHETYKKALRLKKFSIANHLIADHYESLMVPDENLNNGMLSTLKNYTSNPDFTIILKDIINKSTIDDFITENADGETALFCAIKTPYAVKLVKKLFKKHPSLKDSKIKFPNHTSAKLSPRELLKQTTVDGIKKTLVRAFNELDKAERKKVFFDNDYAFAKKENEKTVFEIKKQIEQPYFIKEDGSSLNGDLDSMDQESFQETSYVIIPETHWFAKLYEENPFKNISQSARFRPSIWGMSLKLRKKEKGCLLFEKTVEMPQYFLDEHKFSDAFFKKKLGPGLTNRIGTGAHGEVFSLNIDGKDYAVKEITPRNKPIDKISYEFNSLELLQFTNAVIPVYAGLLCENKSYIVMEKGEKSLAEVIKNKEKIPDEVFLTAAKRMKHLNEASKALGIINRDIKPHNMLLTSDGIKIIDISSAATPGYIAPAGELMARALLETYLFERLTFEDKNSFALYFDSENKGHQNKRASPDYYMYFIQMVCDELNLASDCSIIKNFDELYEIIPQAALIELLADNSRFIPYLTENLKYPQLVKSEELNWKEYYKIDRRSFENQFCAGIFDAKTIRHSFYRPIKKKYKVSCEDTPRNDIRYNLNIKFTDERDPKFQEWFVDATFPLLKKKIWSALVHKFNENTFPYIMKKHFMPHNKELYSAFMELFNNNK